VPEHAPAALEIAGATDVGLTRQVNQDCYGELELADASMHLLVVADGMGGHRGGEVASRMAVDAMIEQVMASAHAPAVRLRSAVEVAHARVMDASAENPRLRGMGTTLVALLFGPGPQASFAHVGDSRIYRLRKGELVQLTDDHSIVGELFRAGRLTEEEARTHPQSNEILRAIGTQGLVQPDVETFDVELGDRFLLCSDGLSGMLLRDELIEGLSIEDPARSVARLIEMANEAGGTDNITAMVAQIRSLDGILAHDTTAADSIEPTTPLDPKAPDSASDRPEPAAWEKPVLWASLGALVLGLASWIFQCGNTPAG